MVEYNRQVYSVSLKDLFYLPVNVVKQAVVKELKEGYDGFDNAKWGNLALYNDDTRLDQISGDTLLNKRRIYGKLVVAGRRSEQMLQEQQSDGTGLVKFAEQCRAFFGKLVGAGGQEDKILTKSLKALSKATVAENVLSPPQAGFPYPQADEVKNLGALFVRSAYKQMYDQIQEDIINNNREKFAISGTPGIGKSLFFIYVLYQIATSKSSWKPDCIVFHHDDKFYVYEMKPLRVVEVSSMKASTFLKSSNSLYVVDGDTKCTPFYGVCIMLVSPRSEAYKQFIKKPKMREYFFPIWEEAEILQCRASCYDFLTEELVRKRYDVYGGVPRSVYNQNVEPEIPERMQVALDDADAIKHVGHVGQVTRMFPNSHILLHIVVGEKHGLPFQYLDIQFASRWVAENLMIQYRQEMIKKLQRMLAGSPTGMTGTLFEAYGHVVLRYGKSVKIFQQGLKFKELLDGGKIGEQGDLDLPELVKRKTFKKETIPKKLQQKIYYQASDDGTFPAVDSMIEDKLFQFTVVDSHPIKGQRILSKLCKPVGGKSSKVALYFIVPPHRYEKFRKQNFMQKGKVVSGQDLQKWPILTQYVVKLPIEDFELPDLIQ